MRTVQPIKSQCRYTPAMASDAVRDRMLAAGQRITPQRDLIAGVLEHADRPVGAQELVGTVRSLDPGVGRATVFRTLQSLQDAGIVQHVTLAGNQAGYLLCATAGHHHHLVCQQCGTIEDLAEDEVAPFLTSVQQVHGFVVDHASFTVYGTCAPCTGAGLGTGAGILASSSGRISSPASAP